MPVINPLHIVAGSISAGTSEATLGRVIFSNSNGVSFGVSGQTITASVVGGGGNTGSISAGTTRATLGEVIFSNSNGLSFGINGQTVTGSYTVPSTAGLISHVNVSAGTTSNNLTNVVFSNSNNVSFGLNGSTITATVASSLTNIRVSAGTTSNLLSAITFSNANGISFGIDAGTITASYTVPAVTNSSWTVSDNATSGTVGRLAFTNLNGVTLSLSTGTGGLHTVVGSHNAITSQTNQTLGLYAVGNTVGESSSTTRDARTISYVGQGIASVGFSNGSINISVSQTVQTQGFSNTVGMSNLGNTSGTSGVVSGTGIQFLFAGGPNITLSQSIDGQSATLTISGGAGGAGNTGSISAGTTRATLGEVVFSNSNGISFGVSGQTVTGSYTVPVVSNAIQAVGSANVSGTNTSRFAADDHVHEGVFSVGVSNIGNTAGNTGVRPGRWVFAGSNIITLSQETAANSLQTIYIQGPGQATTVSRVESVNVVGTRTSRFALEDHQHAGIYQISVIGNTAGNTSAGAGSLVMAGGPNVTLSGSTAAGGMTLSISAPSGGGGGGGVTYTGWNPYSNAVRVVQAISQGSFSVQPIDIPNITFDRLAFLCNFSGATNSTGTMTVSFRLGIYTRTDQTLSLSTSISTSFSILHSGTASSSNWVGPRVWTMPWTNGLTAGNYWVGMGYSTTTGGANVSFSVYAMSQLNSSHSGLLGVGSNATAQLFMGLGRYTAATATPPNSIAFSHIQGVSSAFQRPPIFWFASSTA